VLISIDVIVAFTILIEPVWFGEGEYYVHSRVYYNIPRSGIIAGYWSLIYNKHWIGTKNQVRDRGRDWMYFRNHSAFIGKHSRVVGNNEYERKGIHHHQDDGFRVFAVSGMENMDKRR